MDLISGTTIEVFHSNRQLPIAVDGYVGQMMSGNATIQVIVPPTVSVFGVTKQVITKEEGRDDVYTRSHDMLNLPADLPKPDQNWYRRDKRRKGAKNPKLPTGRRFPHLWREDWINTMLQPRQFPPGTKVFSRRINIEFNATDGKAFVGNPDNELYLVELVRNGQGGPTNQMRVWRLSLSAQSVISDRPDPNRNGRHRDALPRVEQYRHHQPKFFLNGELAYDAIAHMDNGQLVFPRVKNHGSLHALLYDLMPGGLVLPDIKEYQNPVFEPDTRDLADNLAIVRTWYASSGLGSLATKKHGTVRVHWSAVPARADSPNGKRYLVPGELVQIKYFGPPHARLSGKFSRRRQTEKFTLQAYGITIKERPLTQTA